MWFSTFSRKQDFFFKVGLRQFSYSIVPAILQKVDKILGLFLRYGVTGQQTLHYQGHLVYEILESSY